MLRFQSKSQPIYPTLQTPILYIYTAIFLQQVKRQGKQDTDAELQSEGDDGQDVEKWCDDVMVMWRCGDLQDCGGATVEFPQLTTPR